MVSQTFIVSHDFGDSGGKPQGDRRLELIDHFEGVMTKAYTSIIKKTQTLISKKKVKVAFIALKYQQNSLIR